MVNDRDAGLMADVDHGFDARLEVLTPEFGREQKIVGVGYIAPDHYAVE